MGVGRQTKVTAYSALVVRAEHSQVDARVHHLDPTGIRVVQVDQLLGLEIGVRDQHVGRLDHLLLTDDPPLGLGVSPSASASFLTLAMVCIEWMKRHAPTVAREGADLTGEPVVAVDRVVVTQRLGGLGAQHVTGEDAQRPGSSALARPSKGPAVT